MSTNIINSYRFATGGGGSTNGLASKVLHAYLLQEASGNATDSKGTGPDLTPTGSPTYQVTGHVETYAVDNARFGGTFPAISWPTDQLSLSVWYQQPDYVDDAYEGVWAVDNKSGQYRPNFSLSPYGSNAARVGFKFNSGELSWNRGTLDTDPHLVVLTAEVISSTNHEYKLYADGSLVDTANLDPTADANYDISNFQSLALGWGLWSGNRLILEQAIVWGELLTADDVTALWNSGNGLPYASFD